MPVISPRRRIKLATGFALLEALGMPFSKEGRPASLAAAPEPVTTQT